MGLLIPEVFIIILTDCITTLLLLYTVPLAWKITLRWDINSPSQAQYLMEKKRLLASTIVKFLFLLKIPLFLYYIYANDKMANVLTGAMCAAGSVNATAFGAPLLYIKMLTIFMMTGWLAVHRCNNLREDLPHTRLKYRLLLFLTFLVCAEAVLSFLNFANIDPTAVVSCCSSIYSSSGDVSVFMKLRPFTAFYIFITASVLYSASLVSGRIYLILITAVLFFFGGVLNLILFTGTYVYELPSHKCPFCILQKEYLYVGYLFYILLFLSVSGGLTNFIHSRLTGMRSVKLTIYTLAFTILFLILSVFYPIRYFLVNNQWL